jgi:hypothetical protein
MGFFGEFERRGWATAIGVRGDWRGSGEVGYMSYMGYMM